jgi:hypothetical protein
MPGLSASPHVADLPPWCSLNFPVDPEALRTELLNASATWSPQARATPAQRIERRGADDWAVISLRAPQGSAARTDPGLPGEEYGDTEALGRLPHFSDLLQRLPCEIMAARLMRLQPGADVGVHIDRFFGFSYGKVRLHVPVVTSERAFMVFGGNDVHWHPGTLWYGDFSALHTVRNDSREDRIHLVVDCVLSDALIALFGDWAQPFQWLRSRTPMTMAPPISVRLTRRYSVARRALDWTQSEGAALDEAVFFDITLTADRCLAMRLPSGVEALLRPVSETEYRVGRMPEEITVRFDGDASAVIRRARSSIRTWQATPFDGLA